MGVGNRVAIAGMGALLLLAGQALAEEKALGRCYDLRVGAADGSLESPRRRGRTPTLSAAEVKDIAIELSISKGASGRPVQVKMFTPGGPLYLVLDAVGEDGASSGPEGRRRRGRRHARTVVARFPVAGTPVTTHALFGKWRAEVYLGGADTPCARPLEFVLER